MKPYFTTAQAFATESKDASRERESLLNQVRKVSQIAIYVVVGLAVAVKAY